MLREFVSVCSRSFALNGVLGCLLLWLGQAKVFADQSVTLTWMASTDTNAVGYKVYYGGASGVYTNATPVDTETSVTVSGLTEGATYYFSATTVSASGAESDFSNEAVYVITNTATTEVTDTNSTSTTANNAAVVELPTLAAITNLTVYQNAGVQTLPLTGISAGSTNGGYTVTIWGYTSDATIIPVPVINYTSPDSTGTLTFAPATNALGTATVEVKVNNGVNNFSQVFTITVVEPPDTTATLTNVSQANGQFSFEVTGLAGTNYVVQGSSDLVHWTSLQTNTAPFTFQDRTVAVPGQQFYRAFYLP